MLLSGGVLQFALHVCPEQGVVLDKADCRMHEVKDCCKKSGHGKTEITTRDVCCSDAFVFVVSAKFGSVDLQKLQLPAITEETVQHPAKVYGVFTTETKITANFAHAPPGPQILKRNCTWII